MKLALTFAALLAITLTACGEKQETVTLNGNGGEAVTITRTAPDAARVAELKGDPAKLKQVLDECGKSDSTECASARKARSELMYAKPSDTPPQFQRFSGGSRDLQKP
ncbi:MAG: hypothetical protein K6U78_03920 [Anaerolineae bacterium]|nr:hypothetical protein [Anaerolineae bacterium]